MHHRQLFTQLFKMLDNKIGNENFSLAKNKSAASLIEGLMLQIDRYCKTLSEKADNIQLVSALVSASLLDSLAIDSGNLAQITDNENTPVVFEAILSFANANNEVSEAVRDILERIAHGPMSYELLVRYEKVIACFARNAELHVARQSNPKISDCDSEISCSLSIICGFAKMLTDRTECCSDIVHLAKIMLTRKFDTEEHITLVLFLACVLANRVPHIVRQDQHLVSAIIKHAGQAREISFAFIALNELHQSKSLYDFQNDLERVLYSCCRALRKPIEQILADISVNLGNSD